MCIAVSGSVALVETEQNCAKATPNPSIERPEGPDVAVLEVLEPSAHCGVESFDDGIDAVPGPPWRQRSNPVLELLEALVSGSFASQLEVIPEEVETTWQAGIHDARLLWVER